MAKFIVEVEDTDASSAGISIQVSCETPYDIEGLKHKKPEEWTGAERALLYILSKPLANGRRIIDCPVSGA